MTTVALFGPRGDQEVDALANRLASLGATPWIIDASACSIFVRRGEVVVDGRPLLDAAAGYLRRITTSLPEHLLYAARREPMPASRWKALYDASSTAIAAELKKQALFVATLEAFARKRSLVSPPKKQNLHRLKPWELSSLSHANLPVPQLCAGYDRDRLLCFSQRVTHERWSGIVLKPLSGIYKTKLADDVGIACHPLSDRPLFVQRYIEGHTVRCYVLAGRLLCAARIVHRGTIDSSESQMGIEVVNLTENGRSIAIRTAMALGLDFCGIDLLIDSTTSQEYVIDCNISPMFVNFGAMSGCDIAGKLAQRLIETATTGETHSLPAQRSNVEQAKQWILADPEIAAKLRRKLVKSKADVRIALVGSKRDEHIRALATALTRHCADPVFLDFRAFPGLSLASLRRDFPASIDDVEQVGSLELSDIHGAIVRTTFSVDLDPDAASRLDAEAVACHYRTQLEKIAFQKSVATWLSRRVPVLNPPHSHRFHALKGLQHQRLLAHGIRTPSAIVTSDPETARRFALAHGNEIVAKPQGGGAEVVRADEAFFEKNEARIRERPTLFQQLVSGRSMRAYVLGGEVVACFELLHDRTCVDWRERTTGTAPYDLEDDLLDQIRHATRLLELPYCGIDMEYDIRTSQTYFLDFNPSALFVGASRMTGVDIADALAKFAIQIARRGGAPFDSEPAPST